MEIIQTQRLTLRLPDKNDAAMFLELFNQQDFLRFIGDKEVKTIQQAEAYIEERFLGMYQAHGFCLYVVELLARQPLL